MVIERKILVTSYIKKLKVRQGSEHQTILPLFLLLRNSLLFLSDQTCHGMKERVNENLIKHSRTALEEEKQLQELRKS